MAVTSKIRASTRTKLLFVGTYTSNGSSSRGIYAAAWNPEAGTLAPLSLAAETPDPSFLALSPDRRFLYAVNELTHYHGEETGSVSAFAVDSRSGKLELKNVVASGGSGPCNISVDHTGKAVFVANYNGGTASSFRVLAEGGLSPTVCNLRFSGHSVNPERQAAPHTHCVTVSPGNRYLLINDLGLDRIMVYHLDPAQARLTRNDPTYYSALPGSGPRGFAFHPNGSWAYSINELGNTIDVLSWDKEHGSLNRRENIATLAPGFTGSSAAATVAIDSGGRFLYASNRGENTIAVFSIRPADGKLIPVQQISCGGRNPRFFSLDPGNRWLLAANQDSSNLVVFARDARSGRLTPTGAKYKVGSPACLVFE